MVREGERQVPGPFWPLPGRPAAEAAVGDSGHLRWPGDPGGSGNLVHVVGFFETVLDEKMEVVALVEDLAVDIGVELFQPPHFAVLLGHQLLVHRRYLDEEVIFEEVEVGGEEPGRSSFLVPGQREGTRFVGPGNTVEVEQAGELALAVVGKLGDVCRTVLENVVRGQLTPTSPVAATAAGVAVSASSGNNWWIWPSSSA